MFQLSHFAAICNIGNVIVVGVVWIRDETILQYIDILQYLLQQYNTIHLKEIAIYCTLQYIVIYCNILQCLFS